MPRSIMLLVLATVAAMLAACDGREEPQSGLIGTWTKQYTQAEDHAYPGDSIWDLEVTFRKNGQFVWRSIRTEGGNAIDESLTGTYTTEGCLITYRFDKPSDAADKRVEEWFAFWPSQLEGQQTFRFERDLLVLGHDAHKLCFYLKRNCVR